MLPATARLTRRADFQRTVRNGRRCGSRTLVVHFLIDPSVADPSLADGSDGQQSQGHALVAAKFGFVVSKAVGNAVTRNRVKRRLRHLAGEQIAARRFGMPGPNRALVVVRANPAAAGATYERLADDLVYCLSKVAA